MLSTIEIAYSKAHEDAAGAGPHAGYAAELLELTRVLAELLPDEPEVLWLCAIIRDAEARRPARLNDYGAMVPLSEQDPMLWRRRLIADGEYCLQRAAALDPAGPRALQAAIHTAWCSRKSLAEPPPWTVVLRLYDALLMLRDDPVVRVNRRLPWPRLPAQRRHWMRSTRWTAICSRRFHLSRRAGRSIVSDATLR